MKKIIALLLVLMLTLPILALAESSKSLTVGELTRPDQTAESLTEDLTPKYEHGIGMIYFDTFTSLLLALRAEKIDVAFIPECVAKYVCDRNTDMNYVTSKDVTIALSMAVADSDTELLDMLNSAIEKLEEAGVIDELITTYIDGLSADQEPQAVELPVYEGAQTIRIVVSGDLPPLDYVTPDGKPAGFNTALLSAIGEVEKINIELVTADAASRAAMLSSGRADAIFWLRRTVRYDESGNALYTDEEAPESVCCTNPFAEFAYTRLELEK